MRVRFANCLPEKELVCRYIKNIYESTRQKTDDPMAKGAKDSSRHLKRIRHRANKSLKTRPRGNREMRTQTIISHRHTATRMTKGAGQEPPWVRTGVG